MAAMSYEQARKERLEENKRRMEELGLVSLAKELKKPKTPRTLAKAKTESPQEARRSSRVAAKPVVIYREQSRKVPGGVKESSKETRERRERQGLRRRYLTEAARKAAIEAAEEVLKNIKNPAFVKPMKYSRISTVFWIALPEEFCKEHMPLTDENFVLEDEKGKEWECLYIATKNGMSSGWRGFLLDHDLMDGDCCIFELDSPLRFKVHIVRFVDDEDEEEDEGEDEGEDEDESDEGDMKKSGSKKSRRCSSAKKFDSGEDEEDEDDEEEEDDDEEEFDSDVCDDHVSDDEPDEEEDSEDDYSPRLSEKEVDTLVAAPSRESRGLKRKIVKEDDDDNELGHGETSNESQQVEG